MFRAGKMVLLEKFYSDLIILEFFANKDCGMGSCEWKKFMEDLWGYFVS